MKALLILPFIFLLSFARPEIYLSKSVYEEGEDVVVYFEDLSGNANDWIGIYPRNSSNELKKSVGWFFTNGGEALNEESGYKNGRLVFRGIKSGEYEAKLFLNNSYDDIYKVSFKVVKNIQKNGDLFYQNSVEREVFKNGAIYYPSNLNSKYPLYPVIFLSGWWTRSDDTYKTLLRFISSLGYIVIFSKENERYDSVTTVENIEDLIEKSNIEKYIDTSKFGVVGHSSGGGKAFFVLKYFYQKGWGEDDCFVFAMAPWYAFDMRRSDFEKIPSYAKVVIQKYGEDFENDPRISMKLFSLLRNIPNKNKDYQIIDGVGHYFPQGDTALKEKEDILEPLKALIKYTFEDDESYYKKALERGSDYPYWDFDYEIFKKSIYDFPCSPKSVNLKEAVNKTGIDYCQR